MATIPFSWMVPLTISTASAAVDGRSVSLRSSAALVVLLAPGAPGVPRSVPERGLAQERARSTHRVIVFP
jgi:hypothetical protein